MSSSPVVVESSRAHLRLHHKVIMEDPLLQDRGVRPITLFHDEVELWQGAEISVLRDPENVSDANALKVLLTDSGSSHMLGFLPRELAEHLSPLIDKFHIKIEEAHLFDDDEKRFLELFDSLPDDSQRLLIRLYTRKGPWFRMANVSYPEISDSNNGIEELHGSNPCPLHYAGYVCFFQSKGPSKCEVDEVMNALTVLELRQILNHIFPKRLFFLNGEQDLSSFLLVDLGLVKYPNYTCNTSLPIFRNRSDLLAYEEALDVAELMDQSLDANDLETVMRCIEISDDSIYGDAVRLLKGLLKRITCDGRRGYWTLRLSIDLEHMGSCHGRPLNCETGMKIRFYGYDGEQCGVEQLALQHYAKEGGWKGVHAESGIWLTIFGLVMWDVIFADIPNVFRTKFQTAPLDLNTDRFYMERESLIEAHLQKIREGMAEEILIKSWQSHEGMACRGVNWERHSLTDLRAAVSCIGGSCLASLCRHLAQDYRSWSSGMPDLLIWRFRGGETDRGEAKLVEVKSARDRLSEQQRVWLLLLMDCGFAVEVCKVSPMPPSV
ncbi:hypothetical protein QJS10_CPB11g00855 [Acorus calamus]|uniref:Fanconi-associated nuclease n=1 Tax=Acorus calamus TaxID=4465 RepID=A0AAV9DU12_ACOCL|nr:hypothetical protein QJS10_CPB11g00855 [Acorus calamus]